MEFRVEDLDRSQRYKLLIGGVTPRPIAFVSSLSPQGHVNLAPFSFFNAAGPNPMTLMFCPIAKGDGSEKDTLANVRPRSQGGTGEFVVNLAVEAYARKVSAAAADLDPDVDEFEAVGLATRPSVQVAPPRVAASPMAYECVTTQIIELAPGEPLGGHVVFGRVVHVYVRDDVINERLHVDHDKVATLGRMGGRTYTRTRERFDSVGGLANLELDPPFPEDTGG